MKRITTIEEGNDLCNEVKTAGIKFPGNVSIVVNLRDYEFEELVEKIGSTWKIQKSMLRQEGIKIEVNGVSIIYKKNS